MTFNGYKRSDTISRIDPDVYILRKINEALLPALLELIYAGSHQEMDRWINAKVSRFRAPEIHRAT